MAGDIQPASSTRLQFDNDLRRFTRRCARRNWVAGGRGGVRNVLVGTLLIGVLLDGMTILNIPYVQQNLIKSVILLAAIVIDSFVNPRDEQTAQQEQGDI